MGESVRVYREGLPELDNMKVVCAAVLITTVAGSNAAHCEWKADKCSLLVKHHVGHTCLVIGAEGDCNDDTLCIWDGTDMSNADNHHCFVKTCHGSGDKAACDLLHECEFKAHDDAAADCHAQSDVCSEFTTKATCPTAAADSSENNSSSDGAAVLSIAGASALSAAALIWA